MSHNGNHKPPIQFAAGARVPILGQPTFHSWFPTVLITCNCETKAPVLIVGQSISACPSCRRCYRVSAIDYNADTGTLAINVGIVPSVVPDREAEGGTSPNG